MADDVRFVDLLFEQETNGREEFKKMIGSVFKVQPLQCISCHAVPGDRDASVIHRSDVVWSSSWNSCIAWTGVHHYLPCITPYDKVPKLHFQVFGVAAVMEVRAAGPHNSGCLSWQQGIHSLELSRH